MARKSPQSTATDTNEASESVAQAQATEVTLMKMDEAEGAEALSDEPAAPRASLREIMPAVGKHLGKAAYGVVYYTTYGVVYSALSVARVVPVDNMLGRAIKEGAMAATVAVKVAEEEAIARQGMANEQVAMSS